MPKFNQWVANGRQSKPAKYDSIIAALQKFGYADFTDAQRLLKRHPSLLGGSGPQLTPPERP